jgi:hypothetical protein
MAKKYEVVDGFIVNDKHGGETITEAEVERIDILIESGRVIPVTAKSSDRIKAETHDVHKEDVNG